MLCDFIIWFIGLLLKLFGNLLPSAPAGYTNMINYVRTNLSSILANMFFIDGPFIFQAITIYIEILFLILLVFFIWKIVNLIRGSGS